MLKREIGAKGIFLAAALIMTVSLSGCGDGMAEGDSATMEEAVDAAMPEEEADTIATYAIDFMGESNVGTVTFSISPEENENGFVIRSKSTVFAK